MKRMHEKFPTLLNSFNLETLESDSSSIFGLSTDLTINYLNPVWFLFAAENGGEPSISERFGIGTHVGDALAGAAKEYYLSIYKEVLKKGKVWHHDYECSSPETFRLYHQAAYPLYKRHGLVIVNSLVREEPIDSSSSHPPVVELYTQETGIITQCSNCRRVQRVSPQDVWDWVPAWVERMPENISHSFCRICFEYYFQYKPERSRRNGEM